MTAAAALMLLLLVLVGYCVVLRHRLSRTRAALAAARAVSDARGVELRTRYARASGRAQALDVTLRLHREAAVTAAGDRGGWLASLAEQDARSRLARLTEREEH